MDLLNLRELPEITAIILAGGKSLRMGTDKALLEINGKTLLQKTCEVASLLSNQILIVTPWQERYKHLPLPANYEFINEKSTSSPLQAFHLGMERTAIKRNHWILLLACDLPNLRVETLRFWSQDLLQLNSSAYLAQAESQKLNVNSKTYWEPLCGFYHSSCDESLSKYLQRSLVSYSFQSWLEELEITSIESVPKGMLFNCNHPSEWEKIK